MNIDSPVIGSEESMYFDEKPDLIKIEKRIEKYGEANRQINGENNGKLIKLAYTGNFDQRTAKEEFVELLEECGETGYLNYYAITSESWNKGEVITTGNEKDLEAFLEGTNLDITDRHKIEDRLSQNLENPG